MFLRKLNATFIALTVMTAAGFIVSNQQAKAAYTDTCPQRIARSAACAPGEERMEVAAQQYCATLNYSDGTPQACCSYQGINAYCYPPEGNRYRPTGGQDAILTGTQGNSSCKNFRCVYNIIA